MEKVFSDASQCCGCAACADACPVEAVYILEDGLGFSYPQINSEICIGCGRCQSVCAFQNSGEKNTPIASYALRNKSKEKVSASSSGAFFPEIAQCVIEEGGSVFACAFDSELNAVHMKAQSAEELDKFKGSRYIQSKTEGIFKAVKESLSDGKVLFVGTSCQVDALKKYLGKPRSNLITVDVICRGVPSQRLFDDYIDSLEKARGARVVSYSFRAKKIKGEIQDIYAEFSNGKTYSRAPSDDDFKSMYAKTLTLRPSCYSCKYNSVNRVGDLTLGDFWGINKVMPDFAGSNGNSLIIVSSQKGKALFDKVKERFDYREAKTEDIMQPSLVKPAEETQQVKEFREDYKAHGYSYVVSKYCPRSAMDKFKAKLKPVLKKK